MTESLAEIIHSTCCFMYGSENVAPLELFEASVNSVELPLSGVTEPISVKEQLESFNRDGIRFHFSEDHNDT